jgi:hypothetical protein
MEDDSLSVSALLSTIRDALSPVLDMLSNIGWDVGDWTFFLPIAFPLIYWVALRIGRRSTASRSYFKAALIGLVLGGIFEHFQKPLEQCISNGISTCF